jgi:hypothetical protein
MQLYYRISDKSYVKPRLIGATKEVCLMNFIMAFRDVIYNYAKGEAPPENYVPPLRIVADRCERKTNKMFAGHRTACFLHRLRQCWIADLLPRGFSGSCQTMNSSTSVRTTTYTCRTPRNFWMKASRGQTM